MAFKVPLIFSEQIRGMITCMIGEAHGYTTIMHTSLTTHIRVVTRGLELIHHDGSAEHSSQA